MTEEFMGYLRPDGDVGIRNKILILSSVSCVNHLADKIAEKVRQKVEDVEIVTITHPLGCGQFGPDFTNVQRTLTGAARNPNVYGTLVVGLGCENMKTVDLAKIIKRSKKPIEFFDLQDVQGGAIVAIEKGMKIAVKMARESKELKREPFDFTHFILGLECGGSDSISGITANPAVGIVSDKIVELGGTSILPEFTEWIGTEHLLIERAVSEKAKRQIDKPLNKFLENTMKAGVDFRGIQPSPGNIEGGLTTIEEKSLGTIAKGGHAPIQGVLNYSQSPKGKGLWLMLEPGNDIESMSGLAAAGAQLIIFTTGRGTPAGNPIAPVIKTCGNPQTCDWLSCHIDVDASPIITENKRVEDIGELMWQKVKATCNGELTKAEELGYNDFGVWRYMSFPFSLV
jgi:altronate dehydratase large subunit